MSLFLFLTFYSSFNAVIALPYVFLVLILHPPVRPQSPSSPWICSHSFFSIHVVINSCFRRCCFFYSSSSFSISFVFHYSPRPCLDFSLQSFVIFSYSLHLALIVFVVLFHLLVFSPLHLRLPPFPLPLLSSVHITITYRSKFLTFLQTFTFLHLIISDALSFVLSLVSSFYSPSSISFVSLPHINSSYVYFPSLLLALSPFPPPSYIPLIPSSPPLIILLCLFVFVSPCFTSIPLSQFHSPPPSCIISFTISSLPSSSAHSLDSRARLISSSFLFSHTDVLGSVI